jgi:hypothetical protein
VKLTVLRTIPLLLAIDVVLFSISGIGRFKNAKHGADYVVGEIDWLAFLVGAAALLVLVGVAIRRAAARRRVHASRA